MLRDTLVKEYIAGFLGRSLAVDVQSRFNADVALLRDLTTVALITSMDFET